MPATARFGGRHKDSTVENLPQLNEGKVRDKIGEIAGVLP
jgi:hypothetical protein